MKRWPCSFRIVSPFSQFVSLDQNDDLKFYFSSLLLLSKLEDVYMNLVPKVSNDSVKYMSITTVKKINCRQRADCLAYHFENLLLVIDAFDSRAYSEGPFSKWLNFVIFFFFHLCSAHNRDQLVSIVCSKLRRSDITI